MGRYTKIGCSVSALGSSISTALMLTLLSGALLGQPAQAVGVFADGNGCNTNDATAPCFAQNSDILSGQRSLLPVDDIVLTFPTQGTTPNQTVVDDFVLQTTNGAVSSQSTLPIVKADCGLVSPWTPQISAVGRMFHLANDVIVTLSPTDSAGAGCAQHSNNMGLYVKDPQNGANDSTATFTALPTYVQMVMQDFNRDGYQDIFFINANSAQVFTAKCTGNPFGSCSEKPSDGLVAGPQRSLNSEETPFGPPAVGDFNGDGVLDVAWPSSKPNPGEDSIYISLASVCPAAGVEVLGETCSEAFEIVVASARIDTGKINIVINTPAVTAGNFDGAVNATTGIVADELLLAGAGDSPGISADVYRFGSDFTPTKGPNTLTIGNLSNRPYVASGRMDWSEQQEQAVIASMNTGSSAVQLLTTVVTFDADLTMTAHTTALDPPSNFEFIAQGVAVGRFDPPDLGSGTVDFDLQIASVSFLNDPQNPNSQTTRVDIFTIDPPSNFTPSHKSQHNVSTEIPKVGVQRMINVGDTQGRSLVLGAPDKATVVHTQPDTVLGMPPMHLDYIQGLGGASPSVLNLTVFPNTFNTEYHFQTTTGSEGSRKSTTSYTYSTKESAEEKVSYGIPDVDQVSATLKQAATQTHESTVSKNYNNYSGQSFKLSTATEFDDKVIATVRQINLYTYPVIGKFVCPAESPNCPDDCGSGPSPCPKQPLHIQYAGPDNIIHLEPTDAAGLEWYQGAEPGNIFSFPGSLKLLEATVPLQQNGVSRLQRLSPGNTAWGTQSTNSVSVDWTEGSGNQVTSGSITTNSFDASVAVSGSTSIEGFGLSGSASFDYSQSKSASTLNSSSTTLTASTGITVNRGIGGGGGASSDEFLYEGQTYIFGQLAPLGTIQSDLTLDTAVKAQGFLRVGYAANPLSLDPVQAGNWWLQAYNATDGNGVSLADVALVHPQRWLQKLPGTSDQQVMFNCPVGFTSSFDNPECAEINPPPPATPLAVTDALFYQMKGLFITPEGTTSGPPVSSAAVGDTLNVAARIYNYSLATMPSGTQVHAAFYAQPWDDAHGQFASEGGNSESFAAATFIGEDVIAAIPPFCGGPQNGVDSCSDENAPVNFATAQVQWDTTGLEAETYWKIWVVVWMEKDGALVSEIESHGLKSVPGSHLNSLADVPIETYSNNLGFYNLTFMLTTPPSLAAHQPEPTERALTIEGVTFSKDRLLRDEIVIVRATHRASGDDLDSVMTLFYDGDPEVEGELFDVEMIPRVHEGEVFVTPVPYHPRTCGRRTLFVQSIPLDGSAAPASSMVDVDVTIDTTSALQRLIKEVWDLQLDHAEKSKWHKEFRWVHDKQDQATKHLLVLKLRMAKRALDAGRTKMGLKFLDQFNRAVKKLKRRGKIPADQADALIAQSKDIAGCVL